MDGDARTIDRETFARFQRGDEEAAMRIVEAYQHRLLAFLALQTRDHDAAEDIAQEAFLAAYRQRRKIQGEAQLKGWLFTVANRLMWKRKTQDRRAPASGGPEFDEARETAAEEPAARRELDRHQMQAVLRDALGKLAPAERDLVMLRYFGELSIRELAETLNMPMGTVGVKLGRTLKKMREELNRQGLAPGDFLS